MKRCVRVGAKGLLKFQEVKNDCLLKHIHQIVTVLLEYIANLAVRTFSVCLKSVRAKLPLGTHL